MLCLGFTKDSTSHAAVPELMRNASEGSMSKMLSQELRQLFLGNEGLGSEKKGFFSHLGTKACLDQNFGKENAAAELSHRCIH